MGLFRFIRGQPMPRLLRCKHERHGSQVLGFSQVDSQVSGRHTLNHSKGRSAVCVFQFPFMSLLLHAFVRQYRKRGF
jgi:hypothetical protein